MRLIFLGWLFALCAAGEPALAGTPKAVTLTPLGEDWNPDALEPLLRRGELALVESKPDGHLRQVTVIGRVDAPLERVWAVLTDLGRYPEFMPNVAEIEVISRTGGEVVVAYELEVPGSNLEYTLHHSQRPPDAVDIRLENDEGDIQTGAWRWRLYPRDGGRRCLIVYQIFTDVRESSWFLSQAAKSLPSLDHGLNVATGLVTVRAIARRAEALK